MQSISTLVIGVNGEFSASLPDFFDILGDRALCRIESGLNEGLIALAGQHCDVVLVDANLVTDDDNFAVERIRVLCPAATVMLLTVFDKDFYHAQALSSGMDGVISREKFASQFVQLLDDLQEKVPGEL